MTKAEYDKVKKIMLTMIEQNVGKDSNRVIEATKALAELEKAYQMGRVISADNKINLKSYNY